MRRLTLLIVMLLGCSGLLTPPPPITAADRAFCPAFEDVVPGLIVDPGDVHNKRYDQLGSRGMHMRYLPDHPEMGVWCHVLRLSSVEDSLAYVDAQPYRDLSAPTVKPGAEIPSELGSRSRCREVTGSVEGIRGVECTVSDGEVALDLLVVHKDVADGGTVVKLLEGPAAVLSGWPLD